MRQLLLVFALTVVTACAPVRPPRVPPPVERSPAVTWQYGAYLLTLGDAAAARGYLESVAAGPLDSISRPAVLLRDVAEARLFSGDATGAASAARTAQELLTRQLTIAQFRDDDRFVFERTLESLEAAGQDDLTRLDRLARDETRAPSADAWYLLGWLAERKGDAAAEHAAYSAFLTRTPQWAFLRQAREMRLHAQARLR